ncbi:hypothetical protein ACN2MM_05630 [Alkalilimnicola ehrlichii MLHE-1]|uniref:Uncharacterized protein n=1 Tax=Alkalilimnicola ehrlichii (strain ATCC BAA-1101 / DSM 17681 / MLHE-1) TaxID=187272 RepID=Q0A9Y6_ALKEH|nr:hypothetical protein [Alkalilimnicola ehrlichii]ABI56351.1 conserved hypothetical protein [Alkalilimnicola ehrlichii MLHE-1]
MQIKSFDDLKTVGLEQDSPQLLLLVLLRAEPEDDTAPPEGTEVIEGRGHLVPVMATDRELTADLRLDVLVEEADKVGQPWDLIMVSSLSAQDGRLPTSDEAEPYLKQMAEAVENGADLSGYAVFDRAGSPVRLAPH